MDRRNDGERDREMRSMTRPGDMNAMAWPFRDYAGNPFEMFRRYTQEMDRMFGRVFDNPNVRAFAGMRWPAIEVFDRDDQMVVRAELPGVKREDVHVRVVGEMLVIEGERRQDAQPSERAGLQRSEWSYGQFSREIPMPADADSTRLKARMQNGVLEVTLPFRMERQSREITIEGESPTMGSREPMGVHH